LGIDPSTYSGEKGNGFSPQRESCKSLKYNGHLVGISPLASHKVVEEEDKETCQPKNRQSGNSQTHHCSPSEGNLQSLRQTASGSLSGPDIGFGGDLHPHVSCERREDGSENKSNHDQDVCGWNNKRDNGQHNTCADDEKGKQSVF